MAATVAELWRYPVKSMQGERIDRAQVTDAGIPGDRGYVVIDPALGKVGSAKHPRLWGDLLHCRAAYADEPEPGVEVPPVVITLPDGTEVRSDAPNAGAQLSGYLGREVQLTTKPPADNAYLALWPEMEGVMPDDVRQGAAVTGDSDNRTETDRADGTLARHGLSMAAPPGTFFDVSALHVLTSATLAKLGELAPESDFDVRRYRPNIVIDADVDGFAENSWTGKSLTFGSGGLAASVIMPTMRCIMTTLSQPGLPRDNNTLRTVTTHNRLDLPGMGVWSCVGAYAVVASGGPVSIGDEVAL